MVIMGTFAKEAPLFEIVIRRYEKPYQISKRALCKRICLSIGLLQPGDSRDSVVDVLHALLEARKGQKWLSARDLTEQVKVLRKDAGLPLLGVHESNIRRQLRRFRELFLVERLRAKYRIAEGQGLAELFEQKVEKFLIEQTLQRVKDYLRLADEQF
ncbi:hypothetical protein COY28_02795 [Candidatus Woesearchaeota archaeon CG_4_10_14_0_2_um_filter_57_5]|nr:MAG: hypothetical protein AUJ68_05720 [Candidatus Woesearchaeota archaeon CG1_02_57_44]PIN68536.1 MAG: hypothetical protein COV94_04090 [Candidatus Woesearchaeota archaeon CG11_big_fil_rev_8_21_14_0_20_57_5]PIZ54181.1 MAG: hypothetical protein COY28_02795 [Candidatus Woesearchaeota archaeon CG_4_10_14_0_2_um_filter_57_5]